MKIFKKKENVVSVDENGNPIEKEKKTIDWKVLGMDLVKGLGWMCAGVAAFLIVGACMVSSDDSGSEDSDSDSDSSDSEGTDSGVEIGESAEV